jgi:S-adenosylmethionine hydrolase
VRRPIVFVTDYGRDDAYAAALIGAVWRHDPDAICLEGTHGVPPGDVIAASYHIKSLAYAFYGNVVFCAVVDPGVGTERRAIAAQCGTVTVVAPDSGLISYVWGEVAPSQRSAVELLTPEWASNTFHGRDVFAPAAAELAAGAKLQDVGEPIDDPVALPEVFASHASDGIHGRVIVVDHFGNAITTVRAADLRGRRMRGVRWLGGVTHKVVATYADIGDGVAALIGSVGHLEIAARGAPAALRGGPQPGDEITVLF